jgi:hypothetical protein
VWYLFHAQICFIMSIEFALAADMAFAGQKIAKKLQLGKLH